MEMKRILLPLTIIIIMLTLLACQPKSEGEVEMLKEIIAKFAPVEITYDQSLLNDRQKMVIDKLYRAAMIMDTIFLKQVYSQNMTILS
jgi:hypothetical protein